MVNIQFVALSGPPKTIRSEVFQSPTEALAAVKAYAEAGGFTKVKLAQDDDPYDGWRYTATTPGGRAGRNVAFGDDY